MEADFSGYATKAGLKCSDGRTIMPDAFKHQDKTQVPLVWQHGHNDPENVLGHAILEARPDGVYAYGFFNSSTKASQAKNLLEHKDINMLSIWANDLIERTGRVLHGAIREVSLVLSGANPGALIENVTIRHSDGDSTMLDDEAIIFTGLELEHADAPTETMDAPAADKKEDADSDGEETIADIVDSMTDKQREVLYYMIGEAMNGDDSEDTDETEDTTDSNDQVVQQDNINQEGSEMTRNVFEQADETPVVPTLSHADVEGIVSDATKMGSLKEAVDAYALQHGITDIDVLFPEAQTLSNMPEFLSRRTEWVSQVLGGTRKSPFSRVKTISADITEDEARAKGYITGTLKKEEFFGVSHRVTTPTTIYKKQKLDRDDMVDITDFDVVSWLKAEMRMMLDEELARAILIGDGRDIAHADKINPVNIRPIASDHELYTTVINVNIDDANSSVSEIIDSVINNRKFWKGTGLPVMYTTETYIAMFLLLKDTVGRRIYKSLDEVASELRVSSIVAVEAMESSTDIVAILVNPADYVLGADKGGAISMFDDFDIDYNQYKYLIETRVSGALTKLKSAMVIKKVAANLVAVTPNTPGFVNSTGVLTIVNQTGVVYKKADGTTVNAAGSPYAAIAAGATLVINATPASGYYFPTSENDSWTFKHDS